MLKAIKTGGGEGLGKRLVRGASSYLYQSTVILSAAVCVVFYLLVTLDIFFMQECKFIQCHGAVVVIKWLSSSLRYLCF